MRNVFLGLACVIALATCALLRARVEEGPVKVRLQLVEQDTGKAVGGIVRIMKDGKPVDLSPLYPRLKGLKAAEAIAAWHVLPAGGAELTLPRAAVRIEALCGIESAAAHLDLDLTRKTPDEIALKIPFLFRPEDQGLTAGNTHLHLMKLTQDDAENYLKQIPAGDRLRVMFISYLERHKDDATYITNRYPIGDLPQFKATGVLFNNGEEHRHNMSGYGEGYGHVMFLNLKTLVKPVSLGPGITGAGFDDQPLRPGIDDARKQGATIIWCHNGFGHEDVLNALTGRLDALNVFDGSRRGSFEDPYYRYLNIGLRMPISTGTDWFVYDFARVYAKTAGPLSIPTWLDALKAGRNSISNGPLLTLAVDGKGPGETIALDKPGKLNIEASALGRHDFAELQLIHNGKVIKKQAPQSKSPFKAVLKHQMRMDQPGWLAVRIESSTRNELDHQLFAHTSPVYVDFEGKRIFDVDAARGLLKQVEEGHAAIKMQAKFSNAGASDRLLKLYAEAMRDLRDRISKR